MQARLRITRYNKTRYWAIWAKEELLAVTVYRKGAQAVLNYINTQPQIRHNTTMAKTKSTDSASSDPTIIKAVNGEGKTIRIKFDPLGVSVCYNLKGKWQADEIYNQSLPELIAEGVFTIEDEKSQKTYAKYFNAGKKEKRSKAKRSKAKMQKMQAAVEAEARQTKELVAAEMDAAVEAALWQEIEEAREAEQLAEATMEAQDEEVQAANIKEPVTDVAPTTEATAQESGAEAAEQEASEVEEIKLTTYNLKKSGQAPISISPEIRDIKPEPGDQLIRIYKGKLIEVEVRADGYKWDGEVYPTLTHISWKAAGYQIAGNAFFGLPSKPRNKA